MHSEADSHTYQHKSSKKRCLRCMCVFECENGSSFTICEPVSTPLEGLVPGQ